MQKQVNHSISFPDVFISSSNNQNRSNTIYTGLLLNFKSFTLFSYTISLIKCLIHRLFKICNNWNSFLNDIENIKSNNIKNAYSSFLIHKVIIKYLNHKFSSNQYQLKNTSDVSNFKLPYMGNLSDHKLSKLTKNFVKKILIG